MSAKQPYDLLVLGSGPAGLTAALYAHRAGLSVTVLGGAEMGGKVMRHHRIDNYPPFPGGVQGAELMVGWIKKTADEIGSYPMPLEAEKGSLAGSVKTVMAGGQEMAARTVIVATGSYPRRLRVPGEAKLDGKGVFYCATCDAPLLATMERQRALIIGGGNSAAHTALGVLPYAETVIIIMRGDKPRAQEALVKALQADDKASFIAGRRVRAILGGQAVEGVVLEDAAGKPENVAADAVFVGIGNLPLTDFLGGTLELDEAGFIITGPDLSTSQPGLFAAGDVRTTPLRQIVTAAADGALAAQSAAAYLGTLSQ